MRVLWMNVVLSVVLLEVAVALPSTANTTDQAPDVPLEFPEDNHNYRFVNNSSIRENLASHSEIDTEVDDLLGLDEGNATKVEGQSTKMPELTKMPEIPKMQEEGIEKKTAVEWIENGDDTEDRKFQTETTTEKATTKSVKIATTAKSETTEPYKDGVPVMDGSVAGILAGVFLVICIFGYTALIVWRKSLELKYGSREMLVDKDEMYDPDDMRHFSI